jgi:hypothetical protein
MKNILFTLALLISFSSFGQNTQVLNIQDGSVAVKNKDMMTEGEGISYKGSGVYTIQQTGKSDISSYRRIVRKATEKIVSLSNGYKVNYEIVNEEKSSVPVGIGIPRTLITFRLTNIDGSPYITKEDAKKSLLELKEFLDLGIITQQEFDQKAVNLKKVLLSN